MKQVMLTIRDDRAAVHRLVESEIVDVVMAALGAEPDTLEELEAAVTRYAAPDEERRLLRRWSSGPGEASEKVGACLVDLPGRLVAVSSAELLLEYDGMVTYVDRGRDEPLWLGYSISEDWLLSASIQDWQSTSDQRRRERAALGACDVREVLYGKLVEFIVQQCFAWWGQPAPEDDRWEAVREIHRRWLTTPRSDLRDRAPRDWLLVRQQFIDRDLQDRFEQWSRLGECPPGLSRESRAFRFSGFGTNEIVLYYDLCRELIDDCWQRIRRERDVDVGQEQSRMEHKRRLWLETQRDDLKGFAPSEVIERERQRLPLSVSGEAAMADCDCPLCQMMAEEGPVSWNLDESHMDEDFAFSFCPTYQDWESDCEGWRLFEERLNKYSQARKCESQAGEPATPAGAADGNRLPPEARQANLVSAPAEVSTAVNLFMVGGSLAELISAIKHDGIPDCATTVSSLNRNFANLRQAIRDGQTSLLEPVASRFTEELEDLANAHAALSSQCMEVRQQLETLLRRLTSHGAKGSWE